MMPVRSCTLVSMARLLFFWVFLLFAVTAFSQNDILVFKRGHKSLQYFYTGSRISFQLQNKEWTKGIITKIKNDSFYFTKEIVVYHLGAHADTLHFSGFRYALTDVHALPKRGVQIDYESDHFAITGNGGHQHFYWVKSGWIFRAGALGYTGLNIINGIINHDVIFKNGKLGIAAAVFAGGVILKKGYALTRPLGKRYHLESINITAPDNTVKIQN